MRIYLQEEESMLLCPEGITALAQAINLRLGNEPWRNHTLGCEQCAAAEPIVRQILAVLDMEEALLRMD